MNPKVLLIPCSLRTEKEDLVKGITQCDCKDLVLNTSLRPGNAQCTEYAWTIENKYYTADLSLLLMKDPKSPLSIREIISDIEAVVISFDLNDETSLTFAKECGGLFEETDIEVKVLVSNDYIEFQDIETARGRANSWCLTNSFEFVDSYQTDNGDFPGKIGFDRVREILDTHLWPNMERKSKENVKLYERNQEKEEKVKEANGDETDEAIFNGNEAQLESFEALFGQMHEMKLHAQSLPDEERKEYAEKVTLAFWRAMGFDEDEITGL